MTVMDAVKRSKTLAFKKAVEAAQEALTSQETLLWAQSGNITLNETLGGAAKGVKPGVVMVTSHRLVFAYAVMNQRFIRYLLIPDIHTVQESKSSVQVSGEGGSMTIEGSTLNLPQLTAAVNKAREESANLSAWKPPITDESPTEKIPSTAEISNVDLEPYFQEYYPSRTKAAAALHRDTGIDHKQCKTMIEAYFSANLARVPMPKRDVTPDLRHLLNPEKAQRMDDLDSQGIAYCPKCASTDIATNKRGFSIGKAIVGSMFSLGTGFLAGAVGSNKIQCTCLKCGHTWKP